jgi:hypothetical protein
MLALEYAMCETNTIPRMLLHHQSLPAACEGSFPVKLEVMLSEECSKPLE